jgi:hypothetical protein
MRKWFNGLTALVSQELGCDPLDGTLYVRQPARHAMRERHPRAAAE